MEIQKYVRFYIYVFLYIYVLVFREVLRRQKQLKGSVETVRVKGIWRVGVKEKVGVRGAAKVSVRMGRMQFLSLD